MGKIHFLVEIINISIHQEDFTYLIAYSSEIPSLIFVIRKIFLMVLHERIGDKISFRISRRQLIPKRSNKFI